MDLEKFIYSDIGKDILERFYNQGKEIIPSLGYDELLKLPFNEDLEIEKPFVVLSKIKDYEIENSDDKNKSIGVEEKKE